MSDDLIGEPIRLPFNLRAEDNLAQAIRPVAADIQGRLLPEQREFAATLNGYSKIGALNKFFIKIGNVSPNELFHMGQLLALRNLVICAEALDSQLVLSAQPQAGAAPTQEATILELAKDDMVSAFQVIASAVYDKYGPHQSIAFARATVQRDHAAEKMLGWLDSSRKESSRQNYSSGGFKGFHILATCTQVVGCELVTSLEPHTSR